MARSYLMQGGPSRPACVSCWLSSGPSCHLRRQPRGVAGMTKEMIISSSAHETRVAILEDDQVAEIFIEREHQRGVAGNLYKGRVSKVLPGMQSAFVDLGLERDGFLYVSDVVATFEEFDRLETDEDAVAPAGNGAA